MRDVFYGVGAFRGYFSLLGANLVGETGHVYAFEPFPPSMRACQQTLAANQVSHCTLVPKALSNVAGCAELYLGDGNAYRPSLVPWKGESKITISTTTLDQFVSANRPPDLVKVDVEGAETQILEGASRLLKSASAPTWILEVHDRKNAEAVRAILSAHHYELVLLSRPRREKEYPCHYLAWKSPPR